MAILKNTTIDDTGYIKLPAGGVADRPVSPSNGDMRFNTDYNVVEVYRDNEWTSIPDVIIPDPPTTNINNLPEGHSGLYFHIDPSVLGSYNTILSGYLVFDISSYRLFLYPYTYRSYLQVAVPSEQWLPIDKSFFFNSPNHQLTHHPSAIDAGGGAEVANNFTVDVWCQPGATHEIDTESTAGTSGTSGQRYLIEPPQFGAVNGGFGLSVGTNGVSVYEHGDSYLPALLVYQVDADEYPSPLTSCVNITVVYNNKTPSLYLNGKFVKRGLTSPRTKVILGGEPKIGKGSYGDYIGKLSSLKYYNRSLGPDEIYKNFNILRGRFGV